MKLKNSHLWQVWKEYKTRGHSTREVISLKLQIVLYGCLYELSNLPTLQEQINPTNTETILRQKILSSSSAFR